MIVFDFKCTGFNYILIVLLAHVRLKIIEMWAIGVFKSSFQLREMLLVQGETDKIRLDRIKFEYFCIIYFAIPRSTY